MNNNWVKSFSEIPGPKSYPIFGTLLYYLPIIGKYKFDELHSNGLKKYKEFGPVVKEEITPGTNIIWIFNPEDVKELFKREGRHPQRRSHLALDHYRSKRKDLYNTGGLLPTNGPEWYRLRSAFQKGLSSPQKVRSYLPRINDVVDDFIHFMNDHCNSGHDYLPHLSRVFLESLGLVVFDCRLNSFTEKELKPDSRSTKLMESALTINSCILKTDNGLRLWRFWNTPLYNKLKRAHRYMESVGTSLVKSKVNSMRCGESGKADKSLLEMYLTSPELDLKDVIGMASDMLLAGIDTITYSTSFTLYHLAVNEETQEELHKETLRLLPRPRSPVTPDVLAAAHYLKAVLKESFRLNPISVGIGRILTEDAVFSGYLVPRGNIVVTQNQVVCKLDEFFSEPSEFLPERWLNNSAHRNINPYLVLPFGHGPRSCIARRLAEQNMQTLILKLCRNFRINWTGGILGSKSYLINKPDGPLKFSFTLRSN